MGHAKSHYLKCHILLMLYLGSDFLSRSEASISGWLCLDRFLGPCLLGLNKLASGVQKQRVDVSQSGDGGGERNGVKCS